ANVAVERGADFTNQRYLMLAKRVFVSVAIRLTVFRNRKGSIRARQAREERPVELMGERVQLDGVRDSGDHFLRYQTNHFGNDSREIGVTPAEIRTAVEIVLEESDGRGIAWVDDEVGVSVAQTPRLPFTEPLQSLRERWVGARAFVKPRHARQLAHERRRRIVALVGHCGSIDLDCLLYAIPLCWRDYFDRSARSRSRYIHP